MSFSQAIANANRQLSEEEEDKFELVIDVKRARMSRIGTLAPAYAVAEAVPVEVEPEGTISEGCPGPPRLAITSTPTSELDPKDRLARWQRKLLDLSPL